MDIDKLLESNEEFINEDKKDSWNEEKILKVLDRILVDYTFDIQDIENGRLLTTDSGKQFTIKVEKNDGNTNDKGIIVNATWNVNSNALGYKNPKNFRESYRNAIIGAKGGQDIIKRLEKEGGILDGWGKAQGYKVEVIEEKPQYIKIGFGGQTVLTVSKIERG